VPNAEVPIAIPEVPAPQPIAADPEPVTEVPSVIDPAPDAGQSLPRVFDREPWRVDEPAVVIPEPLGAGAWLGIGTGVLAGGGILAALRRQFSKRRRATGIEVTRID